MHYRRLDYEKDMAKQRARDMWRALSEWAGLLLACLPGVALNRCGIARAFQEFRRMEDWARGLVQRYVYVELSPDLNFALDVLEIPQRGRPHAPCSDRMRAPARYRFNPCVHEPEYGAAETHTPPSPLPRRDFTDEDAQRRLEILRQGIEKLTSIAADPHAYANAIAIRVLRNAGAVIHRRTARASEEYGPERNSIWRDTRTSAHEFQLRLQARDTS